MNSDEELSIEIKDGANIIQIEPLYWTYPNADNDWDKNWIHCRITARGGAFKGQFNCNLRTTDLEPFERNLKSIYEDLKGMVLFQSIDGPLDLTFEGDGIGHVTVDAIVKEEAHSGNELRIHMNIDQTDIRNILKQLKNILAAFPVQGMG